MLEAKILENDDWVLCWIFLKKSLKVGRASRQYHLVSFASLSITSQSDICEGFFVSEMFKRRNHIRLEIIPAKAKLLLISLCHFDLFKNFGSFLEAQSSSGLERQAGAKRSDWGALAAMGRRLHDARRVDKEGVAVGLIKLVRRWRHHVEQCLGV